MIKQKKIQIGKTFTLIISINLGFIEKIKLKWFKIKTLLFSKIKPNKLYYINRGFGFYSVGVFDKFENKDLMRIKQGENSFITGPYYDFHDSLQQDMKELNKY